MEWIPEHIKLLRQFVGESQATFAARCGLSRRQTINEWENGVVTPEGTVRKLLDYIAADVGFTEAKRRDLAEKSKG